MSHLFTPKVIRHRIELEKQIVPYTVIRTTSLVHRYRDGKSLQAGINSIPRPGERFNTSMLAGMRLVENAFSQARRDSNTRYVVLLISDGLPKDATPQQVISVGAGELLRLFPLEKRYSVVYFHQKSRKIGVFGRKL